MTKNVPVIIMELQYRNKITYLSFVLAVMIVIRHSSSIGIYDNLSATHYWIEKFISDITDMVVPIFFAVSGFLFYQNFDFSKLRKKLTSRVSSLLIPFVIWNLIGFGFYFIINHIPILASRTGVTVDFNGIFDFVNIVFLETKYNITWFIRDLIVFTLLTPIIFPLLNKKCVWGGYFAGCQCIRLLFQQ